MLELHWVSRSTIMMVHINVLTSADLTYHEDKWYTPIINTFRRTSNNLRKFSKSSLHIYFIRIKCILIVFTSLSNSFQSDNLPSKFCVRPSFIRGLGIHSHTTETIK